MTRNGCLTAFLLSVSLIGVAGAHGAVFSVTTSQATGPGSLGQAILDANAAPGPDEIVFNIPGAGVHKIQISPSTLLPDITDTVIIDGYTQPGANPNTLTVGNNAVFLIQLDGGGPASEVREGLRLMASNSIVRGLSLTGFSYLPASRERVQGAAIAIASPEGTANGCRIEGNLIGLRPDGTASGSYSGVNVYQTEQTVVGGNTPEKRNVISGNRIGIHDITSQTIIAGNYIGTDISGLKQGYGNGSGILSAFGSVIGGTEPGSGNVISDNDVGISLGEQVTVQGNLIGAYADGTPAFGNSTGISITGVKNMIGGLEPGEGNVIAFNQSGVRVSMIVSPREGPRPASGNSILSNLIYANRFREIDLNADGATLNDYQDPDGGPNSLQNYPVIAEVVRSGTTTTIKGGLNSTPSTEFTLQFFATRSGANPSQRLLGTDLVTTNTAGDISFEFTYPVATASDEFITATATSPGGDTSEFLPRDGRAEFGNISTRGNVEPGDNILIGGFIVRGSFGSRSLLIRALGPSLNVAGALSDPELELYDSSGRLVARNFNWKDTQEQAIRDTGLAPTNDREAAVFTSVSGGSYTGHVRGTRGATGLAAVEVYALDFSTATRELVNISTRGRVGTGDDVLIGGVIVQGSGPQKVIVRAIGPDLAEAGVPAPLHDPTLELRDAEGNLLLANDNWRSDQEQEIIATGLAPKDDRDSAIVATLLPTAHTAIVRGKDNSTGIALVEFYKLD